MDKIAANVKAKWREFQYGSVNMSEEEIQNSNMDRSTEINQSRPRDNVKLKREIGLFSAVSMILGMVIGSGIFVSPTSALEYSGSVGFCLIVWAISGLISLLGALAFAELGTLVPRSGAEYIYFLEAFSKFHPYWGPLPAFVCIWIYVMVIKPAEVALLVLTFAQYLCQPIFDHTGHISEENMITTKTLIAYLALGIITYINITSVKLYVKIQNIFGSFKVLACIIVIGGGIYELCIGRTENLNDGFKGTDLSPANIALAFYSGLWAFDGWNAVTVVTEEIKKPQVNVLRSILISMPIVTVLFLLMNVSYMTVLTKAELIASPAVAVQFGERILGPFSFAIPLGVALSVFGCGLCVQFGVTRLCFVAGQEGHMIKAFSFIHIRKLTPAPAVFFQAVLSCLYMLSGDIITLIEFVSFLIWLFYGTAMVALLVMRTTKKDVHRPYRVPTFVPIFILIISLLLAIIPIIMQPSLKYFFAVLFILTGVGVYTPFVYCKKKLNIVDKITYYTQILFEVIPQET